MALRYETQDSVNGTLTPTRLLIQNETMVRVSFLGTYTGVTGVLQGSFDGTLWVPLTGMREDTGGFFSGTLSVGSTNLSFIANIGGWTYVRFNPTACASGTVSIRVTGGSRFELPLGVQAITVSAIGSTITSTSATALTVGPNGSTNPVIQIDANTASAATGVKVTGAAEGGGAALAAISSGTNEGLSIDAKGSGEITLGGTSTGDIVMTRATRFLDGIDILVGTGEDAGARWSTADADNHSFVIFLDNTNQSLHITDKGAVATDWNIAATTDPNLYIHSDTTPATDYVRIGNHTGTVADIDIVGGTTMQLKVAGTIEYSYTASQFNVVDGNNLVVGGSTLFTVGGTVPTFQVGGTTTAVDGSALFITASTTNSSESIIKICKGGNAALGSFTTVAQSENLGSIKWYGDDGSDYATVAASIGAVVNGSGTVAASRVPTDIVFMVDPGGSDDAIAEAMRLSCAGLLTLATTVNSHANMTGRGLLIDQLGNDTLAIALKSSTDVSTGLTSGTGVQDVAVDDYFTVSKFAAATGGALIQAIGENAAVTTNLRIESYGGQPHTTHSTSGRALVEIYATQHDGANALSNATADSNVFAVVGRVGAADVTLMIVDEDGEIHSDGGAQAAYDEHDDMSLVVALDRGRPGYIETAWEEAVRENEESLVKLGILGAPRPPKDRNSTNQERGLINVTKLQRLHNGALRQMHQDMLGIAAVLTPEQQKMLPERVKTRLAIAG